MITLLFCRYAAASLRFPPFRVVLTMFSAGCPAVAGAWPVFMQTPGFTARPLPKEKQPSHFEKGCSRLGFHFFEAGIQPPIFSFDKGMIPTLRQSKEKAQPLCCGGRWGQTGIAAKHPAPKSKDLVQGVHTEPRKLSIILGF